MADRVVVTGSSGFVAHHTLPLLRDAGYDVVPFDLTEGQDICNKDQLRDVITPGCKILHLAAVAKFAEADANPAEAYRTNCGGTACILEVAHEVGAERVVLASTASVYMPTGWFPINEHHPISGNSHYGYSKAAAELVTRLYPTPFVILRYAHIYGTHKWHGGLIDNFLNRIQRGAKPVLYGGYQSNDFTYIKDIAVANILALGTPHLNEDYNIGTGEAVTTEEAMMILCELTGYTGGIERHPIRNVDSPRFTLDIRKAGKLLKYLPKWKFREGLQDMLLTENS